MQWDRLSIWVSCRNGGRPGLFCFRADSSELSDRGNFTVSSESSLRTDRRAQPQKQTKTHRGNKPPAASRSAYNGCFIGKGIGRLSGYSGGRRLWKDRRHGFTLRTEHTLCNSSAAAFSSEKGAKLRRCAETQKHFARRGAA